MSSGFLPPPEATTPRPGTTKSLVPDAGWVKNSACQEKDPPAMSSRRFAVFSSPVSGSSCRGGFSWRSCSFVLPACSGFSSSGGSSTFGRSSTPPFGKAGCSGAVSAAELRVMPRFAGDAFAGDTPAATAGRQASATPLSSQLFQQGLPALPRLVPRLAIGRVRIGRVPGAHEAVTGALVGDRLVGFA